LLGCRRPRHGAALRQQLLGREIIDARHVGKCPADMKAGDMTLSNGQRLNLLEMSSVLAR